MRSNSSGSRPRSLAVCTVVKFCGSNMFVFDGYAKLKIYREAGEVYDYWSVNTVFIGIKTVLDENEKTRMLLLPVKNQCNKFDLPFFQPPYAIPKPKF